MGVLVLVLLVAFGLLVAQGYLSLCEWLDRQEELLERREDRA